MIKPFKIIICIISGILYGAEVFAQAVPGSLPPVVEVSNMAYSYEQMQEDLEKLKQLYPQRIQTKSLGITADGRDVTEVILGQEDASCHILVQSTIHAREYMNTLLTMNQIEDYLRYYYERSFQGYTWSELYENVCFHIIPMANPDGVAISQLGVQGIRDLDLQKLLLQCYQDDYSYGKTNENRDLYFREWKANARGVDLNRNFDIGWEEYAGAGYPSAECYKGAEPASELETQAILKIAEDYKINCCISYHSSGNLVYWNYGSTGEILEADRQLAECVENATRYELHSTIQDAADSAGCSDYFVLKLGIPAVTIENGGSQCPLPVEEYQPMYERNQNLWPALAYLYTQGI